MDESSRTLLFLALLWTRAVCPYGQGVGLAPAELAPIPCNDKVMEKLSRLATTYINEDRTDGFKFALNRIANVHLHAQGPAGNVYYLDLDVLETKCHIGSSKPWKRCDVRPFMETQISGSCNTTVLHTPDGYTYLYSYDCTLVPDPPEKLQQTCPSCPLLLPVDSPVALRTARLTLATYRGRAPLGAELGLKKVLRAAAQDRTVKASFVEYTVQECPEGVSEGGTCQRRTGQSDTKTAGFCTGSVHGDMNMDPDVRVSCEIYKSQNADFVRPPPPGGQDPTPHPMTPSMPPIISDPEVDLWAFPSEGPAMPAPGVPAKEPTVVDPAPLVPVTSSSSSSSESAEETPGDPRPPWAGPSAASSSEEAGPEGGPVALRPPSGFRYQKHRQRRRRSRRQALSETTPTHTPVFLADFPTGPSPFRSCPGPAQYTTV